MSREKLLKKVIGLMLEAEQQELPLGVPQTRSMLLVDGVPHSWPLEITRSGLPYEPIGKAQGAGEIWVAALVKGEVFQAPDPYLRGMIGGPSQPFDVKDANGDMYEVKAVNSNGTFRVGGDSIDITRDMLTSIIEVTTLLKSVVDDKENASFIDPRLLREVSLYVDGAGKYRDSNLAHFRRGNISNARLKGLVEIMKKIGPAAAAAAFRTHDSNVKVKGADQTITIGNKEFVVSPTQLRKIRMILGVELTPTLDRVVDSEAFQDPEAWLRTLIENIKPSKVFYGLKAIVLVDQHGYRAIPVDDKIDDLIKFDMTAASRALFRLVSVNAS